MFEQFAGQPGLATAWFLVIGFFWIGYVVLDGFDLGVGMLMGRIFARGDREQRVLLNTIGPVWDGNEVWLVTAGAATFAAFPHWYAALFSGLYLPLTLALIALILRAVSIEYRGKGSSEAWSRRWNAITAWSSLAIAFLIGALLSITATGLPLNDNGDRVGGLLSWLSWQAVLGGLGMVGFCLIHGLAFVALKTDGPVRERAGALLVRALPAGVLPLAALVVVVQLATGSTLSWLCTCLAVMSVAAAWLAGTRRREGWSFAGMAGFAALGLLAVFTAMYPAVLPSTLAGAPDLTITSASSSPYTLTVMTWVAGFGVPFLLAYQSWTYWVFRRRLRAEQLPSGGDHADLTTMPTRAGA